MNRQKAQEAINKITEDYRKGNKWARKQHQASKKWLKKAEELGILDMIPNAPYSDYIGNTEIQMIIEAAEDSGRGIRNAYGEGEQLPASDLYNALNEEPEDTKEDEKPMTTYTVELNESEVAEIEGLSIRVELSPQGNLITGYAWIDNDYIDAELEVFAIDVEPADYADADTSMRFSATSEQIQEWREKWTTLYGYENLSDDDELTTKQVSEQYHITDATVRQTIARDAIKARKVGTVWLIPKSEADRQWGKTVDINSIKNRIKRVTECSLSGNKGTVAHFEIDLNSKTIYFVYDSVIGDYTWGDEDLKSSEADEVYEWLTAQQQIVDADRSPITGEEVSKWQEYVGA